MLKNNTPGSWIWMVRQFGLRRTFWWWNEGRKRGWMTPEQSERLFAEALKDRPMPHPDGPFAQPPDVPAIPEFDEKGLRP